VPNGEPACLSSGYRRSLALEMPGHSGPPGGHWERENVGTRNAAFPVGRIQPSDGARSQPCLVPSCAVRFPHDTDNTAQGPKAQR
jgi:hypothetical protein